MASPPIGGKQWRLGFTNRPQNRDLNENESFVEVQRNIQAVGDILEIVFGFWKGTVPSCTSKEVLEFCDSVRHLSFRAKVPVETCIEGKAWLNDNQFEGSEDHATCSRKYKKNLTAFELFTALKQSRFGHDGLPDADRRLIYIKDLDPFYILALAETVPCHQAEALKDAVWKHLALQASLKVKISSRGYRTFRLEFHLPYLALRGSGIIPNISESNLVSRPHRKRTDLSFLATKKSDETHCLHEAQISLVVCGLDHFTWVCYAFVDTDFNKIDSKSRRHPSKDEEHEASERDEEEQEEDGEWDEEDEDEDEIEVEEDLIASDGVGIGVDANLPLWNPREYFLRNVDLRAKQVSEESKHVIRTVLNSVQQYRAENHVVWSQLGAQKDSEELKKVTEWTVKTQELLGYIQAHISKTMQVWEGFSALNGDIHYFSDVSERAKINLESVRESFEDITELKRDLDIVCESFHQNYCKTLELRMSLESHRINLESNRINLESNRLNLESHALNRKSHELNFQARELHRDSHLVSLATNRVALLNHRTANLGFSMNQTIAPVAIVVALFSTQQDILHFDRTRKSFVISVFTAILIAWLFAFALLIANRCKWLMRHFTWFGRILNSEEQEHDIQLNQAIHANAETTVVEA